MRDKCGFLQRRGSRQRLNAMYLRFGVVDQVPDPARRTLLKVERLAHETDSCLPWPTKMLFSPARQKRIASGCVLHCCGPMPLSDQRLVFRDEGAAISQTGLYYIDRAKLPVHGKERQPVAVDFGRLDRSKVGGVII